MKIPDLAKKLNILIEQNHFNDIQQIAHRLGKSPNTLKWWIYGSNTHEPNTISKRSVAAIIDLFRTTVLNKYSRKEVHMILALDYSEFRSKVLPNENRNWEDWIEGRAVYGNVNLIPKKQELDIFQIDTGDLRIEHRVKVSERFRLVFPLPIESSLILGFQSANGLWARAPIAKNEASIHLPPPQSNGLPQYIFEQTPLANHRFYLVSSSSKAGAQLTSLIPIGQALNVEKLDQLIPLLEHKAANVFVYGITIAVENK